jgi:hypothetical protein
VSNPTATIARSMVELSFEGFCLPISRLDQSLKQLSARSGFRVLQAQVFCISLSAIHGCFGVHRRFLIEPVRVCHHQVVSVHGTIELRNGSIITIYTCVEINHPSLEINYTLVVKTTSSFG